MKVEIELDDLENIKKQNLYYKQQFEETKIMLEKLQHETDLYELRKKAIDFANRLTHKYLSSILRGIGFEDTEKEFSYRSYLLTFDQSFNKKIDHDWYKNADDLVINVGANVSCCFRRAFIIIGVKPQPPKTKQEVEKDLLQL